MGKGEGEKRLTPDEVRTLGPLLRKQARDDASVA